MRFVPQIPPPPCPFVCIRGSNSLRHFVPFVLFVVHPLLNGRVAELPRGRAQARHPRTTFSSLFPMKNHSCPFVVHISLRHFVPFVVFVGRKNGGRLDLLFREVGSNHWTCRQSRRLPNQEDTTMSRPTRFDRLPMHMLLPILESSCIA